MGIKEEILKEAYGKFFEPNKGIIQSDGWCNQPYIEFPGGKGKYVFYTEDFECNIKDHPTLAGVWMPITLYNRICKNEGWVKVGSKKLFKDGPCWIKREGGHVTMGYIKRSKFYFNDDARSLEGVTHYQRVRKPKEPIY